MNRKNYSDLEPRIKDALQSQADRLDRLYESDPARGEAFLRRVSRRIDEMCIRDRVSIVMMMDMMTNTATITSK